MADKNGITIIKRKKIIAGGHHGGAWKVAYADFVTAMMAFFLLMWLLNATTEEQRKGLADYFNPSIPVHRTSGGGDGPFGGDNMMSQNTISQSGTGATKERPSSESKARGETGMQDKDAETEQLEKLEQALVEKGGESSIADDLLAHIRTRVTDEGLVIEVFDLPGSPLFEDATDQPTSALQALAGMIAEVASLATNRIAVRGHLSAQPLTAQSYDGWALSSDRALTVRGLLAHSGIIQTRFVEIAGQSDRAPAESRDIFDVRNRRVEVILRRSDVRQ